MWMCLIFASAFFLALYDLAKKSSVNGNEVLRVLFWSAVAGASAFTVALVAAGRLSDVALPLGQFALIAVKTMIVAMSWVFTYVALRSLPITIATPIRASAPALTAFAAAFFYGEIPSSAQAIGMVLTLGGYLAFSAAGKVEGIDFLRSHAVWCAVAGMALSSVSALWDKFILQKMAIPQLAMQFWFQFGLIAVYAMMIAGQRMLRMEHPRFEWRLTVPLVGVLLSTADWFYFTALAEPGVAVSLASIMRRTSVVFTFVIGARIFHERNLMRKGAALALILSGIALLVFGSG